MYPYIKREGTYVYLWLINVNVWQKPTQYGKAVILQVKINKLCFLKEQKKKKKDPWTWTFSLFFASHKCAFVVSSGMFLQKR